MWHVNGNSECPIFGVDFKDAPVDDFRYKYTKTFRRLELNEQLHHKCTPGKTKYTKAIVFGHSLNEQDYNYFYALFNNLDLTQERVRKPAHKIEFTYSPHEGQTSEEARIRLISAALKVLQSYNEEILHEPNFRLMDILHFTGAVSFREVSTDFLQNSKVVK